MRVINVQQTRPDEMTFEIHNKKDGNGNILGAESKLHIPILQKDKVTH